MAIRVDPARPHLGGNVIGGDRNTFYPRLWKWLVERFRVASVLDVGCGEGHALRAFAELGCRVHGIDGLAENVAACGNATQVDLTVSSFTWPCDLVWCCEVVEHVDARHVDNVITTLASGRYVAMTHAHPGTRGGYHHVNCQPPEYWIELMRARGYRLLDDTFESRSLGGKYWRNSGLIFAREDEPNGGLWGWIRKVGSRQ